MDAMEAKPIESVTDAVGSRMHTRVGRCVATQLTGPISSATLPVPMRKVQGPQVHLLPKADALRRRTDDHVRAMHHLWQPMEGPFSLFALFALFALFSRN